MLRAASQQRQYDEFYSGDPAFVQPPPAPPEGAADDVVAAHKAHLEEYTHKLEVARERSDWTEMLAGASDSPTKFVMRQLPGDVFRRLFDLLESRAVRGGIANHLIVRCALVQIVNAGDLRVKLAPHEMPELRALGPIASADITNALDAVDFGIVNELAARVLERLGGPSPK
jgi:hypothetical protein